MSIVDGAKITKLREQLGITMTELADYAGITLAMMQYTEQGKRTPNIGTLALIARKLGTTVDELLREPTE